MLNILRKSASSFIIKVLMVILVLTFIFWGLGDISNKSGKTYVVKVGDTAYNEQEFYNLYLQQASIINQQLGYEFNKDELNDPKIKQFFLTLIVDKLINKKLATEVFDVSDDMVKFEIANMPAFIKNNKFDKESFDDYLKKSGLTENLLINLVRESLSVNSLNTAFSVLHYTPKLFTDTLLKAQSQIRVLKTITVPTSLFEKDYPFTPEQLKEIYQENQNNYYTNETRNISYVIFDKNDINQEVNVSEETLKEIYNSQRNSFTEPSKREVRQVVFKDVKDAQTFYNSVKSGEKFEAAAKKLAPQTKIIKLGAITKDYFDEKISQIIFSLAVNQVSEPVHSPLGYHVFLIDKVLGGKVKSLDEVKSLIKTHYQNEKLAEKLNDLASRIDKDILLNKSLEEISNIYGLKISQQKAIDVNNNERKSSNYPNIIYKKEFIHQISNTDENSISMVNPIVGENKYFFLRVDKIDHAKLKEFEAVKSNLIMLWNNKQRELKLQEFANSIYKELNSGMSFAEFTKLNNLNDVKEKDVKVTLLDKNSDFESNLKDIFSSKVNTYLAPYKAKDGSYVIIYIKDIIDNTPELQPKIINALNDEISQNITNELMIQAHNAVKQKYKVEVNYQLLDKLQF